MKKRYILFLFCVLFIFTSLIAYKVDVKADSSLLINKYKVDAELLNNGDMRVGENVSFTFGGSFNGITKEILFPEGTSIENLSVNEGGINYREVSSAVKGDSGVFKVEQKSAGDMVLWIYAPSINMERSFNISYIIKDAAKKYNDTGELYWKFIGNENVTPIASVSINITLPESSKKEDIKLFAHGPLTGNSSILDDRNVSLSIDNLPAGRYVEARVLFPTSVIPEAKRVYKEDALVRILSEETALADEANKEREQAREQVPSSDYNNLQSYPNQLPYRDNNSSGATTILLVVLILGGLITFFYLKSKYGTDPTSDFQGEYYRELPEDYGPAVMSILYYGNVGHRDMTATLMNLVRKKQLKLEVIHVQKKKLFSKKEETDYMVHKLNNPNSTLMKHEAFLLDWMLCDFGNGQSFSFSEVKEINNSRRAALKFKNKYYEWADLVKEDAEVYNFYEYSSALSFKHRTQYGSNQYARWKAFKKFLQDFSNLKGAEPLSLVLWEHYLVYAISLGIAEKVIEQLRISIREEDLYYYENNNMLTFLYLTQLSHHGGSLFNQFEDITSYFENITDSAMSIANSSDSSSSGNGGGFSGGGFGGGDSGGFSGGGDGGGGFGGF